MKNLKHLRIPPKLFANDFAKQDLLIFSLTNKRRNGVVGVTNSIWDSTSWSEKWLWSHRLRVFWFVWCSGRGGDGGGDGFAVGASSRRLRYGTEHCRWNWPCTQLQSRHNGALWGINGPWHSPQTHPRTHARTPARARTTPVRRHPRSSPAEPMYSLHSRCHHYNWPYATLQISKGNKTKNI